MSNKKLKIAITGGIGTGKSVVADLYKKHGYTVISADEVAKEILSGDNNVRNKIIEVFGERAYVNGKPDTKYLGEKVFSVPENVIKINKIVHPPTIEKIKMEMSKALTKRNLVFVEAALIYEAKMEELFDYVILIVSKSQNQIDRVKKRSNLSEDEIIKRMENQLPGNIKKGRADFVIENNASLDELKTKAEFVLKILEQIAGNN